MADLAVGLELGPMYMESLATLGMSPYDASSVISALYARQIACDSKNRPKYLGAIDRFAKVSRQGADELHFLIASERSMGAYTDSQSHSITYVPKLTILAELKNAYEKIGYTDSYANTIFVEAHEAPDDEILRMHRIAVQSCTNPSDKAEMGQALELIGRERNNAMMRRLGGSGGSLLSLEEAYAALSAPADSIDDGLIM
jgi:ubiquitin carboxyl-terminal hydrolase 25/28